MSELLKPGDPCPCCGEPIQTNDPDRLLVLSWLAQMLGVPGKGRLTGDEDPGPDPDRTNRPEPGAADHS